MNFLTIVEITTGNKELEILKTRSHLFLIEINT